jgi:hypothetical protein
MKTMIEGVEITPTMSNVLKKWYLNAVDADDVLPNVYVQELQEVQDFLCRNLCEYDEVKRLINTVINLKDDLKQFAMSNNENES